MLSQCRIRVEEVEEEIVRLRESWQRPSSAASAETVDLATILSASTLAEVDPFDQAQLAYVAAVCRRSRTLSEAGRELFSISRTKRAVANDADRLKKYLSRFGLDFEAINK